MADAEDGGTDASEGNAEGRIVIFGEDAFGVGKAFRSPAAKIIAEAIGKALGAVLKPAETYLSGHAETSVTARRIVKIAQAETKAALIQDGLHDELRRRAAERLIAEEMKKQLNFENALAEALEIAEAIEGEQAKEIPPDWTERWIEGAERASAEDVRRFYSKILAHKAANPDQSVSSPSLRLLQEFDGAIAEKFRSLIRFICIFGCYPRHGSIRPAEIPNDLIQIMVEIGVIVERSLSAFNFKDFDLILHKTEQKVQFNYTHVSLLVSQRAAEIADAVWPQATFEQSFGPTPTQDEVINTYITLINAAINESFSKQIHIIFTGDDAEKKAMPLILSLRFGEDIEFDAFIKHYSVWYASLNETQKILLRELKSKKLLGGAAV